MQLEDLLKITKKHLRLLENYYAPEEVRLKQVKELLRQVIAFEYQHIIVLQSKAEDVFTLLCRDIIRQSENFLGLPTPTIEEARNLLNLIASLEQYLYDVERLPWIVGRKISFREKLNLRGIFRRELHSLYDSRTRRPVRGSFLRVEITGSLATGHSDWKLINGGNIPRPSDYNIPREYRKAGKSVYQKLEEELMLPQKLKPFMSDVDILIMNEVIYSSIDKTYSYNGWSFRLGEKYKTGSGGSVIIQHLHQALQGAKLGGIRGRWVNFIVLRDQAGYEKYMANRTIILKELEAKTGAPIIIHDVKILRESLR